MPTRHIATVLNVHTPHILSLEDALVLAQAAFRDATIRVSVDEDAAEEFWIASGNLRRANDEMDRALQIMTDALSLAASRTFERVIDTDH